jgi:hypothetical protein
VTWRPRPAPEVRILRLVARAHFMVAGLTILGAVATLQHLVGNGEVVVPASVGETVRWGLLLAAAGAYATALAVTPQLPTAAWYPRRSPRAVRATAWALVLPFWAVAVGVAAVSAVGPDESLSAVRLWLGLLGPSVLAARLVPIGVAWIAPLGMVMTAAVVGPQATVLLSWPFAEAHAGTPWVVAAGLTVAGLGLALLGRDQPAGATG